MSRSFNALAAILGLLAMLSWAAPSSASSQKLSGRIAFILDPDVYTMKPDGSDLRQLTDFAPQGARARQPSWSHDGAQIVFHFFASRSAEPRLWIMNADGSNPHQVFDDPGFKDFSASFSPDNAQLAFSRCSDSCAIYRVGVDGSGLTAITQFQPGTEIVDGHPAYSPDGKSIAFTSLNRGGILGATYLMNADGTNIRRITAPAIGGQSAGWLPDGSRLAFSSHCCNPLNSVIWSMRTDGTDLEQVTEPGNLNDLGPWYSPDGDAIVFERDGPLFGTSAIFVKTLDGSAQRIFQGPRPGDMPADKHRSRRDARRARALGIIQNGGFSPQWGPAAD